MIEGKPTFQITEDALMKQTPLLISNGDICGCKNEVIISKELFIECYNKWILGNDKNEEKKNERSKRERKVGGEPEQKVVDLAFYLDRAPGGHRDHRDPGGNAAAGPQHGKREGAHHQLFQQFEADRTETRRVCFRLQKHAADHPPGTRGLYLVYSPVWKIQRFRL